MRREGFFCRYVEREFPEADHGGNAVHSVPREFQRSGGERQANLAEELVFERLRGLSQATAIGGLWMTFFHSASYAGRSFRNQRVGKLMIREHDFVIFAKYKGKLMTFRISSRVSRVHIHQLSTTHHFIVE